MKKVVVITGDVRFALEQLLADLVAGKRSTSDMLYRWDAARGNDWFVETKREKAARRDV